ncbi:MAG: transporter substrate-binding domain-containing protein [Lactococcus sp.]|uniref:Extracellular amino acid-binding protein n=1 Tax=Pseudolactococcus piscium MKFS47 TaxID=297352 RepID=A0A0D6DYI5_9LACT|nr:MULTISPECIES: transporter substrate-binding domain-containing protein [Lactococcus]MCJ1971617.1 transporter substrate-binding domain-containing protein [Lactococcus carnosus]MDN5403663.1 transporter substrate-binding domain-containing protein [Lactococcus sp.]MDN5410371.1 transporter substrate-binding domain-containing protein [Lactococcus sp.]MDN5412288.1 transporter substrate-binding domain-containing protein [Lactococcus sp.]MDN5461865.1 transporter substrate-binding domain-containing pr
MTLKKLGLTLMALTLLVTLAACGTSSKNGLSKIKDKGTLTVAVSPDYAPFEFQMLKDGKNVVVGSDIDLANEIGKALGVKVKIQAMDFNNVLASVTSGKADIAISGISADAERKKAYDFSDSYYSAQNVIVVKKANQDKLKTLAEFKGKKVAAQKGSVQEKVATEQVKDASLVALIKTGQAINELKNGTVEGVVLEGPIAKSYVSANSDLMISDIKLDSSDTDSYCVAMPKKSDALKKEIDQVIKKLKATDAVNKSVEKNFELAQTAK